MARMRGTSQPEATDVAAALEAIRAAVRRNAGYAASAAIPAADASSAMIAELSELATISAHLPVTWSTPVVGRAVALAKRATRLLLRWYVNPIVEQQNAFNEAVVRAVATLDERQREIERLMESGNTST